jgi:hypothetical protein
MYQLNAQQVITNNDKNEIKNVAGSETCSEKKCNCRQAPNREHH